MAAGGALDVPTPVVQRHGAGPPAEVEGVAGLLERVPRVVGRAAVAGGQPHGHELRHAVVGDGRVRLVAAVPGRGGEEGVVVVGRVRDGALVAP